MKTAVNRSYGKVLNFTQK